MGYTYMSSLAAIVLLMSVLVFVITQDKPRVIIDCSAWPSVDECFRDGVAPNWRGLRGIEIIGPPGGE